MSDEEEVTLIFPAPVLIKDWLAQRKAQQETGDYEDVTFTGPVFPRTRTPQPAPGTQESLRRECRWCGRLFAPASDEQRFCTPGHWTRAHSPAWRGP